MTSLLPADVAAARIRLGMAYRRLGHAISGHHMAADDIDAAVAQLDVLRSHIESGARRRRDVERPSGDWGPSPADGDEMFSFDDRPISGRAAPYGLDLTVTREGDEAVGRLTLGAAHEGAPGRSHGGIISALFDDVFGFVLTIVGQAAFTGTLTIRYERGVPIGVPLECRVRLDRQEGRKLFMSGELIVDSPDRPVITRSTAIFISIPEGAFGAGIPS